MSPEGLQRDCHELPCDDGDAKAQVGDDAHSWPCHGSQNAARDQACRPPGHLLRHLLTRQCKQLHRAGAETASE